MGNELELFSQVYLRSDALISSCGRDQQKHELLFLVRKLHLQSNFNDEYQPSYLNIKLLQKIFKT